MRVLNSPVRQPGQPEEPNVPSFGSVQERDKAALGKFEGVASKWPHTSAGQYSIYLAGVVENDMGDLSGAEKSFQHAREAGNHDVSSLAKVALAHLYFNSNRDAEGVKLLKDVIDSPSVTVPKASAQLELAQYYEEKNQKADAVKLYEQMQKDNAKTPIAQLSQEKVKELTGATK